MPIAPTIWGWAGLPHECPGEHDRKGNHHPLSHTFRSFWGRVTRNLRQTEASATKRWSGIAWDFLMRQAIFGFCMTFPWRCILAYSLRLHLYSTILSKLGRWSTGPDFQGEASGLRWEQSNSFGQQMHGLPSKEGQQMLFPNNSVGLLVGVMVLSYISWDITL